MTRLSYVGQHEVEVPALGRVVKPGDVIEVEDPEGYIHQHINWQPVKAAKEADK